MKKIFILSISFIFTLSLLLTPFNVHALENQEIYYETESITQIFEFIESNSNQRGQISSSKLQLTLDVSKGSLANGNLHSVNVKYSYDWITEPLMRFEDALVVTWDHPNLRYNNVDFIKKDYYLYNNSPVLFSSDTSPAKLTSSSIAWYADIAGWHLSPMDSYGYGEFTLVPNTTINSGELQIIGTYYHDDGGSFSLAVKGVSITIDNDCDSRAISKTISLAPRTSG